MFRVVISSVHLGWGLFCYSNFIFFCMTVKRKQIWSPEAIKTNLQPTATSSNISFIYKTFLQTFRKSICFVKEVFLVNSFTGVFWGILRQVFQQLPAKNPIIFGIFSIILSICCCHLVVYYLTKPLWNCVSPS